MTPIDKAGTKAYMTKWACKEKGGEGERGRTGAGVVEREGGVGNGMGLFAWCLTHGDRTLPGLFRTDHLRPWTGLRGSMSLLKDLPTTRARARRHGSRTLGLRSGFDPPDLDRPGRLPHQQGLCEARLGCQDESPQWGPGT